MIPRLDRSVCGCSIYNGSLILAWLYTIGSIAASLLCGVMGPIIFSEIEKGSKQENKEKIEDFLMLAKTIYAVAMVVLIVGVLVNVCLLIGVYKRKPGLMLPHLIYAGIMICFSALGNLISLFMVFTSIAYLFQLIFHLLQTALAIYYWLILYSHYKTIKEEPALNKSTNKF